MEEPPEIRNKEANKFTHFQREDQILNLYDLKEKHCPPRFQISISQYTVTCYKTTFDINNFLVISQAIHINKELKVKLSSNGITAPLSRWFSVGHNVKLTKFKMLENFLAYLTKLAESHPSTILDDLRKRQLYNDRHGQPQYRSKVLRYYLLLRYASLPRYKRLKEHFLCLR